MEHFSSKNQELLTLTTAVPPVVEVAVTVIVIVSPAEMLIPLKL